MENRAHALAAGLFVIILGIALAAAVMWFGGDTMTRAKYMLVSEVPVSGLNSQATVRYRGVTVGKVENIKLDKKDSHKILVQIAVDKNVPLTRNAFAQLGYQGLTGLAYVQLNDEEGEAEQLETDSDEPARIPLRPSLFDSITSSGQHLLGTASVLIERMNLLLEDENRTRFMHILENTEKATGRLSRVLNQLEPGLKAIPGLAADASSVMKNADQLVVDLNQITSRLNRQGGAIDGLSVATVELGETMRSLREATEGIKNTTRSVDRVLLQLEDQPASLLFGRPPPPPGPGETGFVPPGSR
ncbi:MAG: Mammalian cell entry related protein [Nitrosospira multiformis]|jgi:phospholipid/cholesterol/gamma-HCH transport system substrate-binding protein|nr:Mammalian cell entry related protein [Nitrosospira multiformis]